MKRKLRRIIAAAAALSMLDAMALTFPAAADAAEPEILLSQPMDSEDAVNAVIAEGKYEPMVAVNSDGAEANISLSYANANGQYPCLNMTDNNGWYNSAGLKYDITELVAGKTGALTITADLSAGWNGDVEAARRLHVRGRNKRRLRKYRNNTARFCNAYIYGGNRSEL